MNAANFIFFLYVFVLRVYGRLSISKGHNFTSETGEGGTLRARSTTPTPVEAAAAGIGMNTVQRYLLWSLCFYLRRSHAGQWIIKYHSELRGKRCVVNLFSLENLAS